MFSSATSLLHLSSELLLSILAYVDVEERKQVRQTCRTLEAPAASLLFERMYFELCGRGYESLYNASQDSVLSCFVKTIVLRHIRGYRKFTDFDAWAESTHQPGAPDDTLFTADRTTYFDIKELRDQLMPYAEWVAMSREQKEALYHAYNVAREQQHKEIRDITNTLSFLTLDSAQLEFVHPYRACNSTTADAAV